MTTRAGNTSTSSDAPNGKDSTSNKRARTDSVKSKSKQQDVEDDDEDEEDVFEMAPLSKFKEHQHVWCWYAPDNTYRECEVVAAKLVKSDDNPRYRYYIHWEDFNRRMDMWLEEPKLFSVHPTDPEKRLKSQIAAAATADGEPGKRTTA
jgi:ABC-type Zn2+ transport system substrate-binding protein/surface adhesin